MRAWPVLRWPYLSVTDRNCADRSGARGNRTGSAADRDPGLARRCDDGDRTGCHAARPRHRAGRGAKPVGAAIAGNFGQGQSLEQTVQMNPGKCYTIVGAGVPTITNLDIQLVPSISIPGMPAAVVAADSSTGSTAIVGQQPNCYKWALPMGGTMKVVVSVSAGQGMAAAQVFEK